MNQISKYNLMITISVTTEHSNSLDFMRVCSVLTLLFFVSFGICLVDHEDNDGGHRLADGEPLLIYFCNLSFAKFCLSLVSQVFSSSVCSVPVSLLN